MFTTCQNRECHVRFNMCLVALFLGLPNTFARAAVANQQFFGGGGYHQQWMQPGMQPGMQAGMQPGMQAGVQPGMQAGMQPPPYQRNLSGVLVILSKGCGVQGAKNLSAQSCWSPVCQKSCATSGVSK